MDVLLFVVILLFPVLGVVVVLAVIIGVPAALEGLWDHTPWGREEAQRQSEGWVKQKQDELDRAPQEVSPALYEELHRRRMLGFTPAELRAWSGNELEGLDLALLDGLPQDGPITGEA